MLATATPMAPHLWLHTACGPVTRGHHLRQHCRLAGSASFGAVFVSLQPVARGILFHAF